MTYTLDIGDWLKRFVLVEKGLLVVDLQQPRRALKLVEFQRSMAPYAVPNGKGGFDQMSKLWMGHPQRMTVYDYLYRPGAGRLIEEDGGRYLNSFDFPDHGKGQRGAWRFFEAHVQYLFSDKTDLALDWMAHIVQAPGVRPKIVPIHIAPTHGAGRGWVVDVLTGVLGPWNVTSHKMKDIVEAQWGDYLHEKLLVAVHEMRAKGKIYEIDDQIRDIMTESRLRLNLKGGSNLDAEIYARLFMMSNHTDAVALTEADRRSFAQDLLGAIKDEAYFERAYSRLDAGFYAGVFQGLAARDIAAFNPGMRAPMTAAKKRLINIAESDASMVLREMVEAGCEAVTKQQVENWPGEDIPENHILGALRDMAVKKGGERVKWNGIKYTVWLLTPGVANRSETMSNSKARALLDESERLRGGGSLTPADTVVPFAKPAKPPKKR